MDNFNTENQNGVFSGVEYEQNKNVNPFGETKSQANSANGVFGNFNVPSGANTGVGFKAIEREKAITKQGLWTKIRSFLFQEIDLTAPIKVELTPYQQKVEDEINEFLHQEVSFKGISKLFAK